MQHVAQFGNKYFEHLSPEQQEQHSEIKKAYIKHTLNQVSTLHEIIAKAPNKENLDVKATLTRSAELLKEINSLKSTTKEHIGHIKQAGAKQTELEKQHGSPQKKSSNP